jgi:NhaP-type Na+/H+ or K+/H+ antiporter
MIVADNLGILVAVLLGFMGLGAATVGALVVGSEVLSLGSTLFAVIVLNNDLPGGGLISVIVACTIIISAFAHGLTANPLASALAARTEKH